MPLLESPTGRIPSSSGEDFSSCGIMRQYRKASKSVYDIKYHIVWITKYRKPVLNQEIGKRLRELIRLICTSLEVEIEKGHISRDHVYLLVSVPPYLAVSKLVQRIKGLTF